MKRSTGTLVPSWPKTVAAWKATVAPYFSERTSPRELEAFDRDLDAPRKAGIGLGLIDMAQKRVAQMHRQNVKDALDRIDGDRRCV